jgi:hypothetical protein
LKVSRGLSDLRPRYIAQQRPGSNLLAPSMAAVAFVGARFFHFGFSGVKVSGLLGIRPQAEGSGLQLQLPKLLVFIAASLFALAASIGRRLVAANSALVEDHL